MWQDLRHAVRTLTQHPEFVAAAALVLALGIGLNAAMFSIVEALLYRPLPVHAPDELLSLYSVGPRQPDRPHVTSQSEYEFIRDHSEVFSGITAHWGIPYTVRADDEATVVQAEWVLSNYFDVLGVSPAHGRVLLAAEDDVANPERAVVISHALWTRRFKADPAILGKRIGLALWGNTDIPFTVVGVMGPGFAGVSDPWKPTQLWVTLAQGREESARPWSAAAIGRLKPGVGREEAQAALRVHGRQEYYSRPNAPPQYEPRLVTYPTNDVRMPYDPAAVVVPRRLAAAMTLVVAVVLLVAATNIAGILMARGVARENEIAVRRVLGAGSLRIVRQLLAESLLLGLVGGAGGFILAGWLLHLFRTLTPLQFALDVSMNGGVVLFTTGVCLVAGVLVGIVPAWQATRVDVRPWLASGGGTQTRPTASRLRHAITVPQIALSLVLLLIAGVYVRALLRVELAPLGYQPGNLLVASPVLRMSPNERALMRQPRTTAQPSPEERYAERARRFYAQLFERLRALPATQDVAISSALPLRELPERPDWSVITQEAFLAGQRSGVGVGRSSVSPGYFRTMGISITAGREVDDRDTARTPKVVVLSATVAERLWPGRDPIGRVVTVGSTWNINDKPEWYEVVGVANEVSPILRDAGTQPFVYAALGQEWRPTLATVLVRGIGDSRTLIPAVKDAVARADTFAEVYQVRTMSELEGEILYPRRVAGAVLAASGALALFLATIGVYGVVSYSLAQRTGEIGVRMALGAGRRDIIRLILREGTTVGGIGSLAGLALGWVAIRVTSSHFLALPRLDLLSVVLTPLVLTAVVLLACYVPARRAGRLHPMDVLRRS